VREYWRTYRYFDETLSVVPLDEQSKILDIGCGISTVLHFLPGQRFGIDPFAD
jgi:cyclopropane fatty-acyl-phospholipid synthase-like methyltransferase